MVNRFVVHNFFNGDEGCSVQYNNVPRCSGYGPASFAFEDVRPNNVANIGSVCYNFTYTNASFPSGTALCLNTGNYNWYSNCSSCGDSDSSTGSKGTKGQKGARGPWVNKDLVVGKVQVLKVSRCSRCSRNSRWSRKNR